MIFKQGDARGPVRTEMALDQAFRTGCMTIFVPAC